MEQFTLVNIKWISSMEKLRKYPEYHNLVIEYLNETDDLDVDEESDLFEDDFYANDVCILTWKYLKKNLIEITVFPGDTEMGGIFIDNKLFATIYGSEVESDDDDFDHLYAHLRQLDGECQEHEACKKAFMFRQSKYPIKDIKDN